MANSSTSSASQKATKFPTMPKSTTMGNYATSSSPPRANSRASRYFSPQSLQKRKTPSKKKSATAKSPASTKVSRKSVASSLSKSKPAKTANPSTPPSAPKAV